MGDPGRDRVLAAVRRALGGEPGAREPEAVRTRLERPRPNTVPARARLQQPDLTELFVTMAVESRATVDRLHRLEDVPGSVAAYCSGLDLPLAAVIPPQSPLAGLDWSAAGVTPTLRLAESGDPVAVAAAYAGIAETGTLVMLSGAQRPVTANFLPDNHLLVIDERDLVGTPEALWARLRERGEPLPRTVNWITGPSRSGDIEMTMLMGAHGPVRLHVLLVAGRAA